MHTEEAGISRSKLSIPRKPSRDFGVTKLDNNQLAAIEAKRSASRAQKRLMHDALMKSGKDQHLDSKLFSDDHLWCVLEI